jgi:AraC-like DNA-binding protein
MQNWTPSHGPYDTPRTYRSFDSFPSLPQIDPEQLDSWLSSVVVKPISAVEWDWAKGWSVGPRSLNDSMWFWFEKGQGWGWVGNEKNKFQIKEGDLILLPQGLRHMIGQDRGEHCHVIAVHFYAQVFGGVNLLDLLSFPAHFSATERSPYQIVSHRLAREFALCAPGWRQAMAGDIFRVLLYIIRNHGSLLHIPGGNEGHPELLRLLPALKLTAQKLSDPYLTVGDLAEKSFLSESQLRKIFRRVLGISPVRYVQRQRIEQACTILRTTEMKIEAIAEACGFSDVPFFIRTFKSWTNTSPTRFRKVREL